ncbi:MULTISPECIES: carbon storage regulator CsrA [unclassified Paenibacillus]|uniref:carbon storage regulator CsrA n=1 Tax=unclassified Paenibacillus TaxID=185978 RepID=UPI000955348C|nr:MULTISPECIES: carbon storage regulator CsrA [unclassified Paenibacillus]ASS67234.1 carbon storage regulator CsrA [Paenibacillus sp. RUD330]SIQ84791.1 carbon storage regulator, CsrA [Paenibacillus sp. RU4X]SIR05616.1 carbon storage regulator, CsrA [Paenibacillus sp. RU4T]
MLVLSRKKGESILIGHDIELSVLEVTSDGIRLGISAPKDVTILRKELYVAIEDSNRESVQRSVSMDDLKSQIQALNLSKKL